MRELQPEETLGIMSITPPTEGEIPVLVSSKKQRSARNSGKKGWTPAVPEIKRLVGCSYSTNDGFSANMLVWAKLDGGPWWPARVVSVDEIPEDLKKQEEGYTCVKYYGVNNTKSFSWLKAEGLSTFEKNFKEFSQQSIPSDFSGGSFKAALFEIQEAADGRNAKATSRACSGTTKHQESKVLQAYAYLNEGAVSEDGGHAGDVIEPPLKRWKLKFKGVERVPVSNDDLNTHLKGKEVPKELNGQERTVATKSKRRRMVKQPPEPDEDGAADRKSLELLSKKFGLPTLNSSSLSSRDLVKKSRGKKTGADGYYFECMVCDIGGNLLCCDLCPRVYHLECLNPPLKRTPPGKWFCPVCHDTPGALKAVGSQTSDSKPRFKTTSESEATAVVPGPKTRPGPKRGWKLFHKGKQSTPDLDLRKLRKRKRDEDTEHARKKLSLKLNRPLSSQAQPKCRQCGAGINSSGESPSNVFCKECVELVKRNLHPTGRMVLPRKDMMPSRHSKLKPGKCDICSKPGLVIFCDVCPRGFHKDCLNPPRKRAPKGAWSCPKCGPLKDAKEGKDVKEVHEGRDAPKEVKTGKVVKAAKAVKITEERQDGTDEQHLATPSSLEVDRILGCRVSLSFPFTGELVDLVGNDIPSDGTPLGPHDGVLKSESGGCTPGAKSEEGKVIEIRLPICEAEQIEKDTSANLGPNEATSAVIGLGVDTVNGVECRSPSSVIVARDDTTAGVSSRTKLGGMDSRIGPLELKKSLRVTQAQLEFKAVKGVISDEKDQDSSIVKDGLQTSLSAEATSKEEGGSLEDFSKMTKTCSESKDTNRADMAGVNIHASNLQAPASDGTEKGDLDDRSCLELVTSAKDISVSDEIEPPVNDTLGANAIKDSLLPTEDMAVLSTKDVSNKFLSPPLLQPELEFLVKWAGRAHIHNEWVKEERLRSIAKRKLENFKLKHGNAPKMLVEDKWVKPQRIVAKRSVQGKGDEVLVKWSGLSYEDCTWERVDHPVIVADAELIVLFERFEQEALSVDAELAGNDADILNPSVWRGQRLTEVETINDQPEFLKGGSLFPHQMEALNWLRKCWHRQRSVILADEMGLGKTISACSFIASLRHEFKVKAPCLVLVPLSTMPNWLAEFAIWAPSLNVIEYHGCAKARSLIREYEWHVDALDSASKKPKRTFKFHVMLTTYEMVIADSSQLRAVPWDVLVVDEGHRLKNSSSKLFTLLNTFSFSHRVLLTGTPLQNNFGEMFNLLNFLQPDMFPSLAAFQDKFSSLSTAEQVEELKKLVAPNMLRRLKKDAMQKIPPKTELVVPVDMNSVQIEYYKALLTRNYQVLRNGGKHQSMLNIVMQLRKVCNHPYLIAGTEPDTGTPEFLQEMRIKASAKLMLLHSMLGKLKADGHRVLIFSQMTKLLDILEDYLSFEFGQDAFERVDGSVSVADRQTAIARFNHDTSRFVFLLSTRACGLGINLATADTVIIYDSDFNPQADIQAMNRAHRIGQSKTLLVYRLVVRATVEERILQLAKKKLMLDHLFANKTGSQKEVDDILRWGTEELFQENSVPPDGSGSGPGILDKGDDGEAKLRKKGGELGDMYGGYYLQLERSKVVWDDAAVNRLLDRSDLSTCHSEVAQGEPESDILGSLKAWDWNDQDAVPEEQDGEDALGKVGEVEKLLKIPVTEEENQWDKLLRSRWETLQIDEEAALGRGKRNRRVVSYIESHGQKSKELSSEVSDAEEDGSEPDYTPAGRALKLKLAKLRARQKDRIMQRYNNETVRSVDGEKLAAAAGLSWEGTGLAVPIVEGGDGFKRSCKDHGQVTWLGGIAPGIGSSSMGHLFGKPVLDVSAISLTTVSQGLESGQSLSQLLPALRQSLQGVQYANSLQSSAAVQSNFGGPMAATVEGASNNNSSQEESGLNVFPRPANGAKSMFSLEAMKAIAGYQYKCKPPDVALEFSQRIFGGEASFITVDTLSAGEDLSGQQSEQGIGLPSTSLSQDDNSGKKLQRSHRVSGLGVPSLPSTQGPGAPNLSMALGLQLIDTSPNSDVRNSRISTAAPASTSVSSGGSIKIVDIQGAAERLSHTSSLFHKLGTKHMMPIELNDNDSEPIVSTLRFLSPGVGEGAMGRSLHIEDQRNCREQGSQTWSEDELDALWTGVRRHGLGNWAAMRLDSKLCFLKSRSVGELADRWKEEQMKMFGNAEQLSEARRKPPDSWTGGTALLGMGSHPERGFSDTFGIELELERSGTERGSSHTGGTERGLSHPSGTDWGRPLQARAVLTSSGIAESAVVYPDVFSRYQEKKDSLPWVPDLEMKLPTERQPYHGASKVGGSSTLSGLQFVNKTSDFRRLEPSSQACNYRNLLVDFRSSRSSPSIPTSIPGKSTPAAGAVPATNVGSFELSSEGLCRINDNLSRTSGPDPDQIVAEFGTSLSPGLGLGSDWRMQEAKERSIWHQQLPSFSLTDSGKCLSSLPERSGAFRSEEPHLRIQVSLAPSPRLGSPPRSYLGNKALVSLPHNGGPISITEHRRRARGGSSVKAMSSMNSDEAAPSNLPHWLREVVKARSAPPQPPLPSAIAAVVQATNILYKNSSRLLPPLVHPGYPLVPPREFPKKVRRRHQKISHRQPLNKTERVTLGHPSPTLDFSPPIKVEGLNQPIVSLSHFDSGCALNSRPLPALGQVNSSILWSKGFREFPLLPSLDHSKRRQTSHIPSDSLSELIATRRSIIELGLMAGLHPSIVSALNMDELNIQSPSIGKGRRPWPDFGSDLGRIWKVSQSLPDSLLAPSSSLAPAAPLSSERHFERSSQGVMLSQASPVGRKGEASFSDPEKKSQLPQWLLSVDAATTASDGVPYHQPEVDVGDDDNESTSSKTVSDPGVRSKRGKDNEHSDDASSEETISDDGTQ